jgi:hypothetical protein
VLVVFSHQAPAASPLALRLTRTKLNRADQ